MKLLIRWALNAVALWLTVQLNVGLSMSRDGLGPLLAAALVLGLVNAVVRPVMVVLTLPLTFLTLGLFLLVVNAAVFGLAAALVSGFRVRNFWAALVGSVLLSLLNLGISWIFGI